MWLFMLGRFILHDAPTSWLLRTTSVATTRQNVLLCPLIFHLAPSVLTLRDISDVPSWKLNVHVCLSVRGVCA